MNHSQIRRSFQQWWCLWAISALYTLLLVVRPASAKLVTMPPNDTTWASVVESALNTIVANCPQLAPIIDGPQGVRNPSTRTVTIGPCFTEYCGGADSVNGLAGVNGTGSNADITW